MFIFKNKKNTSILLPNKPPNIFDDVNIYSDSLIKDKSGPRFDSQGQLIPHSVIGSPKEFYSVFNPKESPKEKIPETIKPNYTNTSPPKINFFKKKKGSYIMVRENVTNNDVVNEIENI